MTTLLALAMLAQSPTQFATSADGARIAFEVTGRGPAIMLLHGGGQTRAVWRESRYVETLAREFTVILVDLRGHGESARPESPDAYSVQKITSDLLAVADAAGAKQFHLWGFSYGANVGRYLAARSDRVKSMVYIGIPFGAAVPPQFRSRIRDTDAAWIKAMLDYPPVEPSEMKCTTLWLAGTANANTMASIEQYKSMLQGTRVTVSLMEGLNHPQELTRADVTLPLALAFTRSAER